MKCYERLVKEHITSILTTAFDLLLFAYSSNRYAEDAVATAPHLSLEHLEGNNPWVQMLFVDFSSQ